MHRKAPLSVAGLHTTMITGLVLKNKSSESANIVIGLRFPGETGGTKANGSPSIDSGNPGWKASRTRAVLVRDTEGRNPFLLRRCRTVEERLYLGEGRARGEKGDDHEDIQHGDFEGNRRCECRQRPTLSPIRCCR